MQRLHRTLAASVSVITLMGALTVTVPAVAADKSEKKEMTGKEIAFDRSKGNCLACHAIADGDQPGTIGPPMIAMKQRFPDRKVLEDLIDDPRNRNPHTMMPPFGAHGILSQEEIAKVVDFLYTL